MGSPNKYVVLDRQVGTNVRYSVHNESAPKNHRFVAQFKHKVDAVDFITMLQARDAKARDALNHGTLDELAARFPEDFGLKD
jgi:hypothetical protein